MSIYTITTMERKYNESPFVKNTLHMNQKKFDAFLATKRSLRDRRARRR